MSSKSDWIYFFWWNIFKRWSGIISRWRGSIVVSRWRGSIVISRWSGIISRWRGSIVISRWSGIISRWRGSIVISRWRGIISRWGGGVVISRWGGILGSSSGGSWDSAIIGRISIWIGGCSWGWGKNWCLNAWILSCGNSWDINWSVVGGCSSWDSSLGWSDISGSSCGCINSWSDVGRWFSDWLSNDGSCWLSYCGCCCGISTWNICSGCSIYNWFGSSSSSCGSSESSEQIN